MGFHDKALNYTTRLCGVYRYYFTSSTSTRLSSSTSPPSLPLSFTTTTSTTTTPFSSSSPSSSSSQKLQGWRSLREYPAWTEEDAPSNHAGNRGVMSSILRQEEGKQLLEIIKLEKQRKDIKKKQEGHRHPWSHTPTATPSGGSFPTSLQDAWSDALSSDVWQTGPKTTEHASTPPRRNRRATSQYSGVQREVLFLYRSFLKTIEGLKDAQTRNNLREHVREKFDEGANLPKRKIDVLEWQLNYGKRKLEELDALGKNSKFRFVS